MIKIILISLQLLILIFIALFIVNNAFIISFEINDFIYSISSSYVFGFLFFLLLIIFLVQTSYFKLQISHFLCSLLPETKQTFKSQISLFYPNIINIMTSLYETLKDLKLFLIDLIK